MSAPARTASRRPEWLVPALLILLSLVPAVAGTGRLAEIARGGPATPDNARFLAAPLPVVVHVVSVIPFCVVGAFQFVRGYRRRHRAWHRRAGRVLVVLGLASAFSGLWMARFYPWPAGDGVALYWERLVFGSAMALAILRSLVAIGRRDFAAHGEWMMRAYAIGLGAGTQVLTHVPWFLLAGKPGEGPRAVLMGAGWVINVAVAEWVIRRARGRADDLPAGALPAA